jgi:hypothetical protein
MHEILDHLLGDFKQKKEALKNCNLEVLNLLISDLSTLKYNSHDNKNTISALDLWETCLENPNFSIEHLKILFPLIFRLQGYSVRYIDRPNPQKVVNSLLNKKFEDIEVLNLFKELLSSNIEPYGMGNTNLKILIKKITKKNYPKTNDFLNSYTKEQIKKVPSGILIDFKSPYRRNSYFESLYCQEVSLEDINLEIKSRKSKTPKVWKNYKSSDFISFFKEIKSNVKKLQKNRQTFFKALKNRILNSEQIKIETTNYLEELNNLEILIQKQKQDLLERIKDLSVQDKSTTPDSFSASAPQKT